MKTDRGEREGQHLRKGNSVTIKVTHEYTAQSVNGKIRCNYKINNINP